MNAPVPPSTPPGTSAADAWEPTQLIARAPQATPLQGNALPAGTRLGEFELQQVLGEGGFGIVYLAYDHTLRRRVAVKEYMPSTLAERGENLHVVVSDERQQGVYVAGLTGFVNEARMLAQFDHPALVKVHRFWQANGTAYMVMPYYQGTTLKQTLQGMGGAPDERWLLTLLDELTGALAVIHAERCFHRDIAPDNIMLLSDSGKPLLLDFGAARQVIGDATQQLTAILKPGYAPIEQYAEVASMKQGPWTDVYALCAVMYAAITGAKPPVAVGRTVNDSFVPLTRSAAGRYPASFLQAIDHGLRLRPDERPQSMHALRRELGLEGGLRLDLTLSAPPAPEPFVPTEILPRPKAAATPDYERTQVLDKPKPMKPMPVVAPASPGNAAAAGQAAPRSGSVKGAASRPKSAASGSAQSDDGRGQALRWAAVAIAIVIAAALAWWLLGR